MKKLSLFFLVFLVWLTVSGFDIASGPVAPRRTIRMAGDNQFPPFEYVDSSGQYRGFNVELMQALATEQGIYIEFVPMPWKDAVKALQDGRVDAVEGMKVTAERQLEFLFTEPYLTTAHGIFVAAETQYIHELDDLHGVKVAVQAGDFGHELLASRADVHLVLVENQAQALDLLLAGSVDAFVGNRLTALSTAQRKGVTPSIKQVGGPINPAQYAIATRKGNTELVDSLNPGLHTLKRNGTYDKIYQKWFGERLAGAEPWMWWLAVTAGVLALAGALGSTVIYRWNLTLKREVVRQTTDLARANQLNAEILSSAPSGIVTIDTGGIILSANALARSIAGDIDCVGRPFASTRLAAAVHPEHLQTALLHGDGCSGMERSVGSGDSAHTYRYNLAPLRPSGGAVLVIRDVTQEVRMARQLLHHAKMGTVGRMVAGLAHEIRNPLTSLKAFAQLLPTKYESASFREAVLEHIPAEIERLDSLVTDLVESARPRAPQRVPLEAADVLAGAANLVRLQAEGQNTRLSITAERGLHIPADPGQLRQILLNLLLNSLQALREGGTVTLTARREPAHIAIDITDDGPGIAPEDLEHIYEPFFTRRADGTGLGLWMSYQYMRENGGDISIASEPGRGTHVSLTFPAPESGGNYDGNDSDHR